MKAYEFALMKAYESSLSLPITRKSPVLKTPKRERTWASLQAQWGQPALPPLKAKATSDMD